MTRQERLILFLAMGFGLGKAPKAPGTFGTLAGLPLIGIMAWIGKGLGQGAMAFFLVALILAAVFIADKACALLGEKDPGCIVIDEMAGYCVTMSLVPVNPLALVLGFAAFRGFDIMKPPPVRYFERSFNGGAGVVLDDIMAGVLAALLLKIVALTGIL